MVILSPSPPTCCMLYVLALNVHTYWMSYLVIVLSYVASYHSYLCWTREWVNLAIVGALHLVLWTSLLYRQRYIVSLSYDKCTYCKSLWIKGSAECKCKVNDLLFDLQGALVLGSVGSKDWRGSLYERNGAEPGIHIEDPDMKHSSYMGNNQNENTLNLHMVLINA